MNEFNYAENITFDISTDFLKDKSTSDPQHKLEPFDNVFIRPSPYSQSQKTVNIIGEVYYPGDYVILNSKEKITDIIARAGGIKENAYPYGSIFIRGNQEIQLDFERLLKKPNSKYNFEVNDKDKLIINYKPNIIRVVGEINSPGNYKFIPGQRVSRVIKNAGGVNPDADINNIFIEYPNGSSKKFSRWLNNPKVRDGSVITIGKKPEEEPFNKTEYFKELTSIIANLAQALSLVIIAGI